MCLNKITSDGKILKIRDINLTAINATLLDFLTITHFITDLWAGRKFFQFEPNWNQKKLLTISDTGLGQWCDYFLIGNGKMWLFPYWCWRRKGRHPGFGIEDTNLVTCPYNKLHVFKHHFAKHSKKWARCSFTSFQSTWLQFLNAPQSCVSGQYAICHRDR